MIPNNMLPETFTRQTVALTADGQGGWTEVWSDSTEFRGRLSVLPVSEQLAADKVTVHATHRLYCNNLTITEKDRVRNSGSTRYFEIKGIRDPSNLGETGHLELDVLEID